MKKILLLSMLAASPLPISGQALAASMPFIGKVELVAAVAAPIEIEVEGVKWRCEGNKCEGRAERRSSLNSYIKDCRKVAEALGALISFSNRGRVTTKSEIKTCNRLAAKSK